jgi:PBP1b-binding outer membrane lipoprotein LpoB
MKKMSKLAFAVLAAVGFSGCTNMQVAAPAQVAEQKVSQALPSYDNKGGYRMRRFASVAVANQLP